MSVMQKTSEGWKRCDSKNGIAMEIYDSNERMIGMYEGKPLYRKTFYQASGDLSSRECNISNDLTNIKEIVNAYGTLSDANRTYKVPQPRLTLAEAIDLQTFVNKSTHTVSINILSGINGSSSRGAITDISVTLEYTKTTDSPIDINRLDIISQNMYDGEEHQIGMWFGKPLYRRSFVTSAITNANFIISLDVNASNLSIHNCQGAFILSSGNCLPFYSRPTNNEYKAIINGYGVDSSHGLYVEGELGTSRVGANLHLEITLDYTKTTD